MIVFQNQKNLSREDFYVPLLIGTVVLFLCKLIFRNSISIYSFTWTKFTICYSGLLIFCLIHALVETTVRTIEIQHAENKVFFVIQKYFRDDVQITLQLSSLKMTTTTRPSRSPVKNIILTLKDGNDNYVEISSRQKGLSEETLKEIAERIARVKWVAAIAYYGLLLEFVDVAISCHHRRISPACSTHYRRDRQG